MCVVSAQRDCEGCEEGRELNCIYPTRPGSNTRTRAIFQNRPRRVARRKNTFANAQTDRERQGRKISVCAENRGGSPRLAALA